MSLKVPHAAGSKGALQIKGNKEFEACPKLTYDSSDNTLSVEGKVKSKNIQVDKKLICDGAVYHNITKTDENVYKVAESDYTILCDSSKGEVKVLLPPPCNSTGRVLIIKNEQ